MNCGSKATVLLQYTSRSDKVNIFITLPQELAASFDAIAMQYHKHLTVSILIRNVINSNGFVYLLIN